jgi:sensor histidine kinase YesM
MRLHGTADGLSDLTVTCFAEDAGGNLWFGTESAGAMKLAHSGFSSYLEAEVGIEAVVGGSGYGLTTMSRRAAAMRGTLHRQSTPGKGTTLTFTLPLDGARPGRGFYLRR